MEDRNNFIFYFFIAFLVFVSCSKVQKLETEEYMKYIENAENGITVTKEIEDFEFSILYKPLDYVVALENRKKNISKDSILNRIKKLKGYQYYTFRIRSFKDNEFMRTNLSSEDEYYSRLEYMVSYAQNDISLVEGNDTLPCVTYHFERNYGISPYNNIVLAFEERDSLNKLDKIFIYDDKILGLGKIALKINASDLIQLPKLNI